MGLEVAKWMVTQKNVRFLVLLARRKPNKQTEDLMESWRSFGCTVLPFQADISDTSALQQVIAEIDCSMPPLRGVVHCAGTVDDGAVVKVTPDRAHKVLSPKLAAWNLHSVLNS